ncbi:hypothetical protein FQN54_005336 [Arachnomyces sp. PD_36]|nr:hypothetical protein FQN54_005336 [Arachnomyces sp. PD_36]
MAASLPTIRPLGCWKSVFRGLAQQKNGRRSLSTIYSAPRERPPIPQGLPQQFHSQLPPGLRPTAAPKEVKIYPPPASACNIVKDPVANITASQLAILDPTGERAALFNRKNPEGAKVGDILRVTFKNGDPFAGVCLNIRSRGIDTAFLLRNQLTKVGCEMWIKVHSPNVKGVEVVQRTTKRKRRARLYYMRQPKHDVGSVEGLVRTYLRDKAALAGGVSQGKTQRGSKNKKKR